MCMQAPELRPPGAERLPLCSPASALLLPLRLYCGRHRHRGSSEPITSTPRTVSYCTPSFPESAKLSFTLANGGIAPWLSSLYAVLFVAR
jgi:hypothetical protein